MTCRCACLLTLAVFLSACGGDQAIVPPTQVQSEGGVQVTLGTLEGPTLWDSTPARPTISCAVSVDAVVTGAGGGNWLGATLRIYQGQDRTTPLDSLTLSAADVQQAWGHAAIVYGETQHSRWTITTGIPFSADIDFQYQAASLASPKKRTKITFTCAPHVAANPSPPTITALAVTVPGGTVNAGGPIPIAYTATAPSGVFLTDVHITGPCTVDQFYGEKFQTSVSRTVNLTLPRECRLGQPVHITVIAMDAAAQTSAREHSSAPLLMDLEPPTLSVAFEQPFRFANVPSGDYAPGDSIAAYVQVTDNHRLSTLIWEALPFGVKDSLILPALDTVSTIVQLKLRADWSGSVQFRLFARDSVGLTSTPITTPPDSIRVRTRVVIPVSTGTIAGEARQYVVDERRGRIYVVQANERRLAVVSMATLQVVETLALPEGPIDLDLTASGDSLVLALYQARSLGILDLRQATLSLTQVPLSALDAAKAQRPVRVRALANGHVFVASEGNTSAAHTLFDVNLRSGAQRERLDIAVNGEVGDTFIGRSPDNIYMAVIQWPLPQSLCLRRYDPALDSFSACVKPKFFGEPSVSVGGSRIAVATDVYDATLKLLPRSNTSLVQGFIFTALSPDGQTLYEPLGVTGLVRVEAATGRVIDFSPIPTYPDVPVHISASGKTLVLMRGMGMPSALVMLFTLP
jgi:hypothetical protein